MTNDDVKFLAVEFQNLPFIPGNIDSFFPNVRGIEWLSSNLTSISAADLEQFPELLLFSVEHNNLISIDGDLFQHNPLLRWINFSRNQIQHVGLNLFRDLNDLRELYFFNNPCASATARNREDVLSLIDELPILCPPLPTTTTERPPECPVACLTHIESSDEKISEMSLQIADHEATISELDSEVKILTERLLDLERIVREMNSRSNPWSV